MNYQRHTLLDITDRARQRILDELSGTGVDKDLSSKRAAKVLLSKHAGARIPGVVRREEGLCRPGWIPVGFSSQWPGESGRMRLATFVMPNEIISATSPFELLSNYSGPAFIACTQALDVARSQARELDIPLGVWGSVALELYTGLPCTHNGSDLDLLVGIASRSVLESFLKKIMAIETHFDLRIDVELDLPNGYGVHLKELFGVGHTVIGKSLADVALFPREELLATMLTNVHVPHNTAAATERIYV